MYRLCRVNTDVDNLSGNAQTVKLWIVGLVAGKGKLPLVVQLHGVHYLESVECVMLEVERRVLGVANRSRNVELLPRTTCQKQ